MVKIEIFEAKIGCNILLKQYKPFAMTDSLINNDSRKAEKIQKILSGLDSPHSHNVYRCLVEIRTKFATNDGQKAKSLVSMGLVAKLIPLLERSSIHQS